ncbi:Spy/CpxP family protein refolding chaperone [Herbaspirillum sp. RTI4]|uniref:Spy/CpxP family protein refolding chaperone n=1 Tax=Herbaspirillum sp. RTI4 TaxID=3048640 RepID=UPI002AB55F6F|nr:Spy/CpxP family protein refolding chaperone [Herbaspirillum sp. RTI4]MDY7579824.1 Spy/CpxP family protein refolding chaperone [Herbaspirillum sp. RTI4]MEA9981911.1 Spy/CpxP family protein refolding chaperone [Herbaspirillum sp. RTI4]
MLKLRQKIATGLLATAFGTMTFFAQAQSVQPAPPAPVSASVPAPGEHGEHGGRGPRAAPTPEQIAKFKAGFEKHLAAFHDKLQLTSAQEPAWHAFNARMHPDTPPAPRARLAKDATAPERLQQQIDMLKNREEMLSARLVTVKDFYAVLNDQQKKVFDQQTARFEHHFWQRGGHGGDRKGGHEGGHEGGKNGAHHDDERMSK